MKSIVELTPIYYRSIAKIAFHFLLQHSSSFTGRESQFDLLKSFIISGVGSREQFLKQTESPRAFKFSRVKDSRWMHIMAYSLGRSAVTIDITLFAGVFDPTTAWEVVIDGFEWLESTTVV